MNIKALAVFAMLCGALPASAAECTSGMINGRWALYMNDITGNFYECFFTVRLRRNLTGPCVGLDLLRVSVRGTLTVNRACTLRGDFGTGTIIGMLQSDRQGGAGILDLRPGGGTGGLHFSLVRRP